ncbi:MULTISPECIES: hypothetical protein [Streptomyces]|uniref:Uncharacterized protein n=1 Tax=Streptomyces lycii TaxID=2654337 RepID=A0ABQ7FN71_9ACTN|nr:MULTISPECIES: hypothetical protein [Streptomyces]KAF4408698.1 hypothetical protein GCU69_12820 [Streptomyces lycii]PGH49024.1 hypothetical protein CRI70_19965 [Streptomyces sp. Ru87]
MSTASIHHHTSRPPAGSTALGAGHPRHVLGEALRAVRVFAGAVFSVVVLGEAADAAEEHVR